MFHVPATLTGSTAHEGSPITNIPNVIVTIATAIRANLSILSLLWNTALSPARKSRKAEMYRIQAGQHSTCALGKILPSSQAQKRVDSVRHLSLLYATNGI